MRQIFPVCRLVLSCGMLFGISGLLVQSSLHVRADGSLWQQFTYSSSAGSRPYFVYTPEKYRVGETVPLVVMLHGCTQTATDFALGTKMNRLADQNTFIVMYPQQQGKAAFAAMGTITRVIPTIVFQGSSDLVVHPINSDQVTQQWMRTDQLTSNGAYKAEFGNPSSIEKGQIPFGHTYSVFKWNDTHGYEIQEYWKINGMGHAWSGGSPENSYTDPSGPDTSMAMLQFFMGHPLL